MSWQKGYIYLNRNLSFHYDTNIWSFELNKEYDNRIDLHKGQTANCSVREWTIGVLNSRFFVVV